MKLRSLQLVILVGLLAVLAIMASGLAAQEAIGDLALTATALAGSISGGTATITPLPSLTPGGPPVLTSTPPPGNPTSTPLPSLTPGLSASVTPLPSLTPVGQQAATQVPATTEPTVVPSEAATSTPLPSLTPVVEGGAAAAEAVGTPSGEALLEATAIDAEATAVTEGLAPVSIEVPYVTTEQEPPPPPASAAGMGTLILLFGLGGATVIGLLMLSRDRYRDHREE